MADRQPTIEQKSHFSAKTKEGQDVEFEATLKFYISPTGDVTVTTPGSTQYPQSPRKTSPETGEGYEEEDVGYQEYGEDSQGYGEDTQEYGEDTQGYGEDTQDEYVKSTERTKVETPKTKVKIEKGKEFSVDTRKDSTVKGTADTKKDSTVKGTVDSKKDSTVKGTTGGMDRNAEIDKAFPRGPPSECKIVQFIPDPCRAIDDFQKSVKKVFTSIFSGHTCPPCPPCPPQSEHPDFTKTSDEELNRTSKVKEGLGYDPPREDKTESEAMHNEQKYEM